MYLLGWLWLALWSFIVGFAHNWGPIAFSVARGFQGIGPAILVPNAMALIGRTYPVGDKRALVYSIFGTMGPTGFLTGAALASVFAELVCAFLVPHGRGVWLTSYRVALVVLGHWDNCALHHVPGLLRRPRAHDRLFHRIPVRPRLPGMHNGRFWAHPHQLCAEPSPYRRLGRSICSMPPGPRCSHPRWLLLCGI
jgi:MFS family permease